MSYISRLTLQNFRNYNQAQLSGLEAGFVVLTGENGAGKTNVLEAVSLLAPGRGLRSIKIDEAENKGQENTGWVVSSQIETPYGRIPAGTAYRPPNTKRIIRIKGREVKAQADLLEYLTVLWLTPQMDGLFLGSSSDRRRFFDRMVQSFDASHAGRLTRYENALRQRSKILGEDENPDLAWLSSIEVIMAETALAIAASRIDFIARLNAASKGYADSAALKTFPTGVFKLDGFVEERLRAKKPALKIEDDFKRALEASRKKDSHRGGAAEGTHKTDILVTYRSKEMPADQCSTGEQKALLTGIILSFAKMLKEETGIAPILLLDEIAAHFDAQKRAELFQLLHDFGAQSWITGTDAGLFEDMPGQTRHYTVKDGKIL